VAFYIAFDNPWYFFAFYSLSELLDAVDGHAARFFNQSTTYGAVLDMVTDRCSTAALLVVLSRMYPQFTNLFSALIALDLTSHYAHLYSSLKDTTRTGHKDVKNERNFFIRLYYGNRYVLFFLCAANEAMFLGAYLLNFTKGNPLTILGFTMGSVQWFFWISLIFGSMKQFMNFVQMVHAFQNLAEMDMVERARHKSHSH